ncbi:hypothetical protein PSEUDO8AS_50073 [Pseudomonas sp. 8AS]|nr:hypothetical protein PSEUDO8AS_50073 [Pseudomonas sp. 8AS]
MIEIRLASLALRTAPRPGLALCPLGLASRDRAMSSGANANACDRAGCLAKTNLKWLDHYLHGTGGLRLGDQAVA